MAKNMKKQEDLISSPEVVKPIITYFRMGHAEMNEGWSFSDGSWGVRVDGVLEGVFPRESDAMAHVGIRAGEIDGIIEKIETA